MPWVKLTDTFADHPKVDALLDDDELKGLAALGLWVLGLVRSGQQLTDGAITPRALQRLAPEHARALTEALVRHGLLDQTSDGYQIHGYLEHNPLAADVLDRRRRDAERKARERAVGTTAAASARTSQRTPPTAPADVPAESERTTSQVQTDVPAESESPSVLPDPTRPDPNPKTNSPGTANAGKRAQARGDRTTPTSEDEVKLADEIRNILQRGVDGLTTTERVRAPTREGVLKALREHKPSPNDARALAIEVRAIAQSQNRAPNIVGLYTRRLAEHHQKAAA